MENKEPQPESHEQLVSRIILEQLGQNPEKIERMTVGTANEVYKVTLPDREVIARLSSTDKFLRGSHNHIPIFKKLGIKVPDILAEDYSKTNVPYCYQIQSKLEGKDLDLVISALNAEQLKNIAKEIAAIFKKIQTIPSDGKFGYIYGQGENLVDTWTERIDQMMTQAKTRGLKTGVWNDELEKILSDVLPKYQNYFDAVKSETYFDDMSSKNVLIDNGEFSGLVDLDCLAEGDYLETVGRIKASWYGTPQGTTYTEAVMHELGLNEAQKKIVTMYALLNRIYWTCENGMQFNQNTKATVDKERDQKNKAVVEAIYQELQQTL
jgi:aminoglycoside phosphotransferase (APT) family kinase protein